jgi:hypothetical protein
MITNPRRYQRLYETANYVRTAEFPTATYDRKRAMRNRSNYHTAVTPGTHLVTPSVLMCINQ